MAAFAPAYPPDSGDPNSAAPLDSAITALPGASGASSASRVQWNTCATSVSQLRLKVCHVWCLDRPRQRGGAGVEHQNARAVGVGELPGHGRVGGIDRYRGEGFAEFCAQFFQQGAIAGDPDDLRARLAQGGGDATAEAPAGAG